MVVIIYCYIGCESEVTTCNENREDYDVDIFNIIQKVQDPVIHLEVDEEQWEITQGSKRGKRKYYWQPYPLLENKSLGTSLVCQRFPKTQIASSGGLEPRPIRAQF